MGLSILLNGRRVDVGDIRPHMTLLEFIRERGLRCLLRIRPNEITVRIAVFLSVDYDPLCRFAPEAPL